MEAKKVLKKRILMDVDADKHAEIKHAAQFRGMTITSWLKMIINNWIREENRHGFLKETRDGL